MSLSPYKPFIYSTVDPSTPWPRSKCHRIIRPLKTKIAALEKAIDSGKSVAYILRNQERRNVRKYGQKLQSRNRQESGELKVELLLKSARNEAPSASIAATYNGLLSAFDSILKQRPHSFSNTKSLSQRAAEVVGRCIVWSAMDDVGEDEWYDCVPEQWTRSLIIGHATQLIVEQGENIKSLLPALVVLTADYGAVDQAQILLKALMEYTKFTAETPSSVHHLLQLLCRYIHRQDLFKTYLQQMLTLDHIIHPTLLPETLFPVTESSLLLIVRVFELCAQRFKKKCASNAEKFEISLNRLATLALELVGKSKSLGGKWNEAVCYVARIILRWKNAVAESWTTPFPSVGYLLGVRAIQIDTDDPVIQHHLIHLYTVMHKSPTFRHDLQLTTQAYSKKQDMTCLINEMDLLKFSGLAIALANCWQRKYPNEDLESWIAELENKAVQLGVLSSTNKSWKWENLIQGWIEETPTKPQLHHKLTTEQSVHVASLECISDEDGLSSESTPRTIRKRSGLFSSPIYTCVRKPLNTASVKHVGKLLKICKAQKQQTTPGMSSPLVRLKGSKHFEPQSTSPEYGFQRKQAFDLKKRSYKPIEHQIESDVSMLLANESDITTQTLTSSITIPDDMKQAEEPNSQILPVRQTKSANNFKRKVDPDFDLDELCIPLKRQTRPLLQFEAKKRRTAYHDFSDDELDIL